MGGPVHAALELLDVTEDALTASTFLDLFNSPGVSAHDRAHLLLARRFALHLWVRAAGRG